jgi:CheY-like chemotaxis protein
MVPPTLLLIEDNEDDVFAFQRGIKKAGITLAVHHARDGQQAVEFLRNAASRVGSGTPLPALVFLDLKLPGYDGLEVLTWIRGQQALNQLPVVILSGSNELRDRERTAAIGVWDYLVKPASPEDLKRLVKSVTDRPGTG